METATISVWFTPDFTEEQKNAFKNMFMDTAYDIYFFSMV